MGKDYSDDTSHTHPPGSARNEFHFKRVGANSNKPYLLVEYTSGSVTVSGTVSLTGGGTTAIVVNANGESVRLNSPGPYSIAVESANTNANVTAFADTNGNNIQDPWEPVGAYAGNPISLTSNLTGIDMVLDSPPDTDHDGMSDAWEQANGLIVGVNDALLDKDSDGLTNIQEYYFGTNPSVNDSDGDGVLDGAALAAGLNPHSTDTDGDGMPDAWEIANGLNPLVNDAGSDYDGDGLTNLEEYLAGTNPRSRDSNNDGISDYEQVKGVRFIKHVYDRNERLVTTYFDNGASEAWRYDGNGNLVRHILSSVRDKDANGLPDAWEIANGLYTINTSGSQGRDGDADGDGWTNYQEYLAGTNPNDASDHPTVAASVGMAWFNPPKSRILFPPTSGGALAHVSVRIWDAEANNEALALQWWDTGTNTWKTATLSKVNNTINASTGALATSATGVTHDLLWNAITDLPNFNGTVIIRTTAQDPAGTTASEAVPLAINTAGDFDGDGIPDAWEIAHGMDPNSSADLDGSAGDGDHDGLSNFGEYAFGLNPAANDGDKASTTGTAINPADGRRYLILSYRRRLDAGTVGLTYTVQTSSNLVAWTSNGTDVEAIGNAPTGDGITELVTVRIKPSVEALGQKKFARVTVSKP